jgi:hypothetical protein
VTWRLRQYFRTIGYIIITRESITSITSLLLVNKARFTYQLYSVITPHTERDNSLNDAVLPGTPLYIRRDLTTVVHLCPQRHSLCSDSPLEKSSAADLEHLKLTLDRRSYLLLL